MVVAAALLAPPAAIASTGDFAQTARNVIPSGQPGAVPPPAGAEAQAKMYDGLTPLFDRVTNADLDTYFKSELFGVGPDGPSTVEPVPRPGVTIERDAYGVPHVSGQTTASGRPAGSPPRTVTCSASRPDSTPAWPRSTRPGSTPSA